MHNVPTIIFWLVAIAGFVIAVYLAYRHERMDDDDDDATGE